MANKKTAKTKTATVKKEVATTDIANVFKDEIPQAKKNWAPSQGVGEGGVVESFSDVEVSENQFSPETDLKGGVRPNVELQLAAMQNSIAELAKIQRESLQLQASEPAGTPRGHDIEQNNRKTALTSAQKTSTSVKLSEPQRSPAYVGGNPEGLEERVRRFIAELASYETKARSLSKEMVRDIDMKRQDSANADNFKWFQDRLNDIIKG
jgi:hypothetical protein